MIVAAFRIDCDVELQVTVLILEAHRMDISFLEGTSSTSCLCCCCCCCCYVLFRLLVIQVNEIDWLMMMRRRREGWQQEPTKTRRMMTTVMTRLMSLLCRLVLLLVLLEGSREWGNTFSLPHGRNLKPWFYCMFFFRHLGRMRISARSRSYTIVPSDLHCRKVSYKLLFTTTSNSHCHRAPDLQPALLAVWMHGPMGYAA